MDTSNGRQGEGNTPSAEINDEYHNVYPSLFAAVSLLADLVLQDQVPTFQASPALKQELRYLTTSAHVVKGPVEDTPIDLLQAITDLVLKISNEGLDVSSLMYPDSATSDNQNANSMGTSNGRADYGDHELAASNPRYGPDGGPDMVRRDRRDLAHLRKQVAQRVNDYIPAKALKVTSAPSELPPPPLFTGVGAMENIAKRMEGLNERGREHGDDLPGDVSSFDENDYYSSQTQDGATSTDEEDAEMSDGSDYEPQPASLPLVKPASPSRGRQLEPLATRHMPDRPEAVLAPVLRALSPYRLGRWESKLVWNQDGDMFLARPRTTRRQ
ncbi:hypothetical protein CAC42_4830 [Sphaceloma murrayae]|uniref:Uncharacterized protein n=1 Tax=Sphaceloma murrayae TaxID=2082308 RepID=A0A2K1QP35_9PEZI|nr:hypothetical protein CAC42_4830 [Sphaceloma murrayae]